MIIDEIEDLEFRDRDFVYKNKSYEYKDILSILFNATVTQRSINGIPIGKSYDATLRLTISNDRNLDIKPTAGFFGRMNKKGMSALQHAYAVFSHVSFNYRIARYEKQLKSKGYFSYDNYRFHKSGHLHKEGEELCNLLSSEIEVYLQPFALIVRNNDKSLAKKVTSFFFDSDEHIDISRDLDCILYLMNSLYQMSWADRPPPEKAVDRHELFYTTVLRFGAMLANADGSADPSELNELKRFFQIDSDTIPDSARIFNEQLQKNSTVSSVLSGFAKEFDDNNEIKENFILGMILVAYADGVFDVREYRLLVEAVKILNLDVASLERIAATAGLNFDFQSEDDDYFKSNKSEHRKSYASNKEKNLRILELDYDATIDEIKLAYRRVAKKYHPDILKGQGMPDNEIERATQILVEVNRAYEELMKSG